MSVTLDQQLYRTAVQTFEDLAFLLPLPDQPPATDPADTWASVTFRGPFSGRLLLGCHRGTLETLAANMLGDSAPPSQGQQLDALREVANVLCGNLLPAIAGTQAVFRMEAPVVSQGPLSPREDQPVASAQLSLVEGSAQVMLYVDASAAWQVKPA